MIDFRTYDSVQRFQLDKRPGRARLKMECPACGRPRCFTPFIDVETGAIVGNEFGFCDHKRTCGYYKIPTGKDIGDRNIWASGNDCISAYKPPVNPNIVNFIPFSNVAKTVNPDGRNKMFRFLSSIWGVDRVSDIFRRYYVGTANIWSWKGCSLFWQIDKDFVCRTGKIMDFYIKEEDGRMVDVKRVKEKSADGVDKPHVMFYHSLEYADFMLRQCLFGEHLLTIYPDKVVNLVEAEKTAIICAINRPDELFLATGGLLNLRQETTQVLIGRKTVAFPDKGSAYEIWKKKVDDIMMSPFITVSDYLEKTDEVGDGDDVADLIIKNKLKEEWEKTMF